MYSSPFLRCMQTAAAIAEPHGLKIRVEYGISEMLADCAEHGWGFSESPFDEALTAARLAGAFNVDLSYAPLFSPYSPEAGGGLSLCYPESWDEARARYQRTLAEVRTATTFSSSTT